MELTEGMKKGILSVVHLISCKTCGTEQKAICDKTQDCQLINLLITKGEQK